MRPDSPSYYSSTIPKTTEVVWAVYVYDGDTPIPIRVYTTEIDALRSINYEESRGCVTFWECGQPFHVN